VDAIAFGEGAPHLHLHLIPRFAADPTSTAWSVADLYRDVLAGAHPPADPDRGREVVEQTLLDGEGGV
jgi:diadenosine tetraphosphate (Ap4A) HIT family hydrolase